jgi:hypothetical protein
LVLFGVQNRTSDPCLNARVAQVLSHPAADGACVPFGSPREVAWPRARRGFGAASTPPRGAAAAASPAPRARFASPGASAGSWRLSPSVSLRAMLQSPFATPCAAVDGLFRTPEARSGLGVWGRRCDARIHVQLLKQAYAIFESWSLNFAN